MKDKTESIVERIDNIIDPNRIKDLYLWYLDKVPELSKDKITVLQGFLQQTLAIEIGYVRPIFSPDSGFRVWLGHVEPSFYGDYYLGIKPADHQDVWRREYRMYTPYLLLAARSHGKSEVLDYETSTWEICYIDSIRILLISRTDNLAGKHLFAVKQQLETNKKLIEDFTNLREGIRDEDMVLKERKGKWTQNIFYVVRYSAKPGSYKDPTMEAVGIGSAITGGKFDRIKITDMVERKDCRNKKNRDWHEEWVQDVVENMLEPNGRVSVDGTHKHEDDVYARLEKNLGWKVRKDKAVIRYPEHYEYIYDIVGSKRTVVDVKISGDPGKILWEDPNNEHAWTMKKLLIKKEGMLPHIWEQEWQQDIETSATSTLFPYEVLETNFDVNKVGHSLTILTRHNTKEFRAKIMGADFSAVFDKRRALEKDTDFTVYTVLGLHRVTYDRQILYMFRDRGIPPDQQIDKLIELYDDFECADSGFVVVETNNFQQIYAMTLQRKKIKIYPHTTGGEKWSFEEGLPAMALDFQSQRYIIPRGNEISKRMMEPLITELGGLGIEAHDDCILSLWFATLGCNWMERKDRELKRRKDRVKGSSVQIF